MAHAIKKFNRRKWIITATIVVVLLLWIKENNMTWRQSLMKKIYSVIMLKAKLGNSNKWIHKNEGMLKSPVDFYTLQFTNNKGENVSLSNFKNKKVLLVNTASNCGYTGQYTELQKLYEQYENNLVVIGFPANDFKEQEKGTDDEIASFCQINYGVTFLLAKKSVVVKNDHQNEVFAWLSDSTKNGWCNLPPDWNFTKYLINEQGVLTHRFGKEISPLHESVLNAIK